MKKIIIGVAVILLLGAGILILIKLNSPSNGERVYKARPLQILPEIYTKTPIGIAGKRYEGTISAKGGRAIETYTWKIKSGNLLF